LRLKTLSRLRCVILGHDIQSDKTPFAPKSRQRCRCGKETLFEDKRQSRVGHILSCFFFGHDYLRVGERDGHAEFICKNCGHPLLFEERSSRYASKSTFHKAVSFACIVLGHKIHQVSRRNGITEYACHCGHSFLLSQPGLSTYRHPLACVVRGHYIRFVERRGFLSEFGCHVCGHTFCFDGSRGG